MLKLLKLAAEYSQSNSKDKRTYFLGAVGVRADGRIVHSRNEAVHDTCDRSKLGQFSIYKRFPESHAEARLTKKLGFNGTVYVARIAKGTNDLAMARPCCCCQAILKAFRVDNVFYSISPKEWGRWHVRTNTDSFYGLK